MGKVMTFILGLILVLLSYGITLAETQWSVLVGIDKYQSQDISSLKGAVNDAKSLAETLIRRLNQMEVGSNYRLPTEAEWEFFGKWRRSSRLSCII